MQSGKMRVVFNKMGLCKHHYSYSQYSAVLTNLTVSISSYYSKPKKKDKTIQAHAKYKVKAEPGLVERFEEPEKLKYKQHPGIVPRRVLPLPEYLTEAITHITQDYKLSDLRKDSKQLARKVLESRHLPQEKDIHAKVVDIEMKLLQNQLEVKSGPETEEDEEMRRTREEKWNRERMKRMQMEIYKWKPTDYTIYMSILYLNWRMAPERNNIQHIFKEIQQRDPDFEPKKLFDFGSGVGSVTWAANAVWPDTIDEHFCVEKSKHMTTIAQLVLWGGSSEGGENRFPGVHLRSSIPSSFKDYFDVVVSAYSLMELPSKEARLQTIQALWEKTKKYLVLVEYGSNAGFQAIAEAREFILEQSKSEGGAEEGEAHVFSPCPHDFACPRLKEGKKTPCNFMLDYAPHERMQTKNNKYNDVYSYVVLRKGERDATWKWPRLVRTSTSHSQHIHARLCTDGGTLEGCDITRKRHGKHLYKLVKLSNWGDRLPTVEVIPEDTEDEQPLSTKETLDFDRLPTVVSTHVETRDEQPLSTTVAQDTPDIDTPEKKTKDDTLENDTSNNTIENDILEASISMPKDSQYILMEDNGSDNVDIGTEQTADNEHVSKNDSILDKANKDMQSL